MGSHECKTNKRILRCASRRNNRIDKHTILESLSCRNECLLNIVNIKRNNRTLCLTNLEALLLETTECVTCDSPKGINALWLFLNDVKRLKSGSGGSRSV